MTAISFASSLITGATCLIANGLPCHVLPNVKLYRQISRPRFAGSRDPLAIASRISRSLAPRSRAWSRACLVSRIGFICAAHHSQRMRRLSRFTRSRFPFRLHPSSLQTPPTRPCPPSPGRPCSKVVILSAAKPQRAACGSTANLGLTGPDAVIVQARLSESFRTTCRRICRSGATVCIGLNWS